jgi:hypothetical protein
MLRILMFVQKSATGGYASTLVFGSQVSRNAIAAGTQMSGSNRTVWNVLARRSDAPLLISQ